MTDRIEELGRAKEGVIVTYRVAFDDGTTSIIQPSKHAIAFEWQTSTYLGQISDQAVFGKAAKAAKAAAKAAKAAAPPRGLRMEVACCDADQEGVWEGEWEECELIADHGDTCDVRIIEDDEVCRGVPRRLVREAAEPSIDNVPCARCALRDDDEGNTILLCDGDDCKAAYHQRCLPRPLLSVPEGEWLCPACEMRAPLQAGTGVAVIDAPPAPTEEEAEPEEAAATPKPVVAAQLAPPSAASSSKLLREQRTRVLVQQQQQPSSLSLPAPLSETVGLSPVDPALLLKVQDEQQDQLKQQQVLQKQVQQQQEALARSPALRQMRQQAHARQQQLRQQQMQQMQQHQMQFHQTAPVHHAQRMALQQMHAQQMQQLFDQHNAQIQQASQLVIQQHAASLQAPKEPAPQASPDPGADASEISHEQRMAVELMQQELALLQQQDSKQEKAAEAAAAAAAASAASAAAGRAAAAMAAGATASVASAAAAAVMKDEAAPLQPKVEPPAAPTPAVVATMAPRATAAEGARMCPAGHALERSLLPLDATAKSIAETTQLYCDGCQAAMCRDGNVAWFSCAACDFDVCLQCAGPQPACKPTATDGAGVEGGIAEGGGDSAASGEGSGAASGEGSAAEPRATAGKPVVVAATAPKPVVVAATALKPAVVATVAPKPVAAEAMVVVQESVTAAGKAAGTAVVAIDGFGGSGGLGGGAAEAIDETAFNRRFLAFRQYLELRIAAAGKEAKRTWKLPLRRPPLLVDDVLSHFRQLAKRKAASAAAKLFQLTQVTFRSGDEYELEEEGRDEGGLSAEMFSSFFREVLKPEAGLFEPAPDAEGGGLLPRSDAPEEDMEAVGRVIVKALIDDHPLGHGLAPVALEFLCGVHEESFATVTAALAALRHFDPTLADNWASLLTEPAAQAGLTVGDFPADAHETSAVDDETPLTADIAASVITRACRCRLVGERRGALLALRRGFTEAVDLQLQLAPLSRAELAFMLQAPDTCIYVCRER